LPFSAPHDGRASLVDVSAIVSPFVSFGVYCARSRPGADEEELPPGQAIKFDPIDSILWAHILFMSLSFGILFPAGIVHHHPIPWTVYR